MELGDRHLNVSRASIGMTQASGLDMGVNAMSMFAKTASHDLESSRVLQLLNMVTPEELMDNDDYEGMYLLFGGGKHSNCFRNPRRRVRGVPEIRKGSGDQSAASVRGQPTVAGRGQDLCQIRRRGRGDGGAEGAGGEEVCGPDRGDDVLFRGEFAALVDGVC
jgi:hypothetical protein